MESRSGLVHNSVTYTGTDSCELRVELEAQVRSLQQLVAELVLSNERLRQALGEEYRKARAVSIHQE